jgi:hypothetical protein
MAAEAVIESTKPAPEADESQVSRIPNDDAFEGQEFLEATEIEAMAAELARFHPDDFPHFEAIRIGYLWHERCGMKDGGAQLGFCQRTPVIGVYYADTEFTVWVETDNCRLVRITPEQMTALIFDLSYHIQYNEDKDRFRIRSPEVRTFLRMVQLFGPWHRDLRRVRSAFAQAPLPLFAAGKRDDDMAATEDTEEPGPEDDECDASGDEDEDA